MKKSPENRVLIFDTTLRDGEQAPGASLSVKEKVEIAHQLEKMRVDIIEAGFPISSPVQFEAVKAVASEIHKSTVAGLARAVEKDITCAYEAIKDTSKARIHTFIATSDIHLKYKLKKSRSDVLKMVCEAVKLARSLVDDVEFSAEDAFRTAPEYLLEVVEAAIEAGAGTVNIPDTVGYAISEEFGALIKQIMTEVPNVSRAVISVHCHNDLGLASANSLAAVKNGARQVEVAVNGLGERAGNASLEEVVMAINTRSDFLGVYTNIKTEEITRASRLTSSLTGIIVQPNKAIVGANAFAHEAGIHVHGVLSERSTYEIMTPQSVGLDESRLVLGRHSGRHAMSGRLKDMGYILSEGDLDKIYDRFLFVADKKKEIFDEDLMAIVDDEIRDVEEYYKLKHLQISCGTGLIPTATVELRIGEDVFRSEKSGDGPVDATYAAIKELTHLKVKLDNYSIRSVTGGTEAIGEVSVRIKHKGKTVIGRGSAMDIIVASAKAFVDGLNRLRVSQKVT